MIFGVKEFHEAVHSVKTGQIAVLTTSPAPPPSPPQQLYCIHAHTRGHFFIHVFNQFDNVYVRVARFSNARLYKTRKTCLKVMGGVCNVSEIVQSEPVSASFALLHSCHCQQCNEQPFKVCQAMMDLVMFARISIQ